MSPHLWTWIAWLVLCVAPFATGALCWHYGLAEGAHRGRCAERERQLARVQRAAMRAPYDGPVIRAKTGPTRENGYWNPACTGFPCCCHGGLSGEHTCCIHGPAETPGGAMVPGEIPGPPATAVRGMKQRRPDHITAADLAPVVVPQPGTVIPMRPQPAGTGPHTQTMPAATDTGELRALTAETDAWLEEMRQRGLLT